LLIFELEIFYEVFLQKKKEMKRNLILTLMLGSSILFSCNNTSTEKEVDEKVSSKAIDLANMDTLVKPQDNFYDYATGGWRKNNPLKDEYSRYGTFDALAESNVEQVKGIIENAAKEKSNAGSVNEKIGKFYASGMDTLAIDKAGIESLKEILAQINAIKNTAEIPVKIAEFQTFGIYPLFYAYGSPDRKNSEMMIAELSQGGLGIDRDYYLESTDRAKTIRAEYQKYIAKLFVLAGNEQAIADKNAQTIMNFETRLAKASMTRLERRDPIKTYNKMDLAKIQAITPNFDWKAFYKAWGLENPGEINVEQPNFFKEVNKMLKEVAIDDWKLYLTWNLLNSSAEYLSKDFVVANFDFYGKTLQGKKEMKARWKEIVENTNYVLGEAVGELYVAKYFPAEAKERMLKLVENLRIALGSRIDNLTWMSDGTKKAAREKLAAIRVKVGYPDKWKDYSSLEIKEQAYILNVFNGRKFAFAESLAKIGKPVDKNEWHMTPQTVNAYYNPAGNEIVFPAGILQPPFFYLDADDAVNYGAIGVVIGHEMTHGFDDQGRNFDKNGNMTDWWTKEDADKFKERTQVLVNQYNNFIVLGETHADGQLSLGENIADLGGINIALDAFKLTEQAKKDEKIDNFMPNQRFFLAYAKIWGQNIRDEEILRRTKEDVHSLGVWRVNGPLPNVAAFYEAFNVKESDKMYLAPEKRADIW